MAQSVYVFVTHLPSSDMMRMISHCILMMRGKIKESDFPNSVITAKIGASCMKGKRKISFYFAQNEGNCCVRAVFAHNSRGDYVDKMSLDAKYEERVWERFVTTMKNCFPMHDFGMEITNGKPRILAVQDISNPLSVETRYSTTGSTSISGALLGGLLFGPIGAVIGGTGGSTRTTAHVSLSTTITVKVLMSNGNLREGMLKKTSKMYHEIMAMQMVQ